MIFIDGDNLTARFQAMRKEGYVEQSHIRWRQDCYVWAHNYSLPVTPSPQVVRAYYYCSVVGDEEKIVSVVEDLKTIQATANSASNFGMLSPVVFKKENQKDKASGVDVQLTVDALNHIYNDNLDIISIVSGDGDFMPVAQEAIRHGKRVHAGALSSGLNQKWRRSVDGFYDMDSLIFNPR